MKTCSQCDRELPLESFGRDTSRASGYRSECRDCRRPRARREHLKRTYGISLEDYQQMLLDQHGRCAICDTDAGEDVLDVDHDHETGEVRGLLCRSCNVGLGKFRDNTSYLAKAILYLEGSD